MTVHRDIVRRIREDHLRLLRTEETAIDFRVGRIPTDQRMVAKLPEIPHATDDECLFIVLHRFFLLLLLGVQAVEERFDLGDIKASQRKLELAVELGNRRQFKSEQIIVPAGQLGKPVVGDDVGAFFRFGHMLEAKHRHLCHSKKFRGLDAAMAGDDLAALVDEYGIGEAEAFDAFRDLRDLFL